MESQDAIDFTLSAIRKPVGFLVPAGRLVLHMDIECPIGIVLQLAGIEERDAVELVGNDNVLGSAWQFFPSPMQSQTSQEDCHLGGAVERLGNTRWPPTIFILPIRKRQVNRSIG